MTTLEPHVPDGPLPRTLRIGTRSSPLALAQARIVAGLLRHDAPDLLTELVPTTTRADRWHGDLTEVGGKGGFVTAIDEQLQRGAVDIAVHCVKDVPGDQPLPDGLAVGAYPARADRHDVLVVPRDAAARTLDDLPSGARVGTSAVRRAAQLLRLRPDLTVVRSRGAVGTRLARLDGEGDASLGFDALVLASAGLARVGLAHRARYRFTATEILPAVGAGVLAVSHRQDDQAVAALVHRLNDEVTMREVTAERAMLRGLAGHCNSPIAGSCRTGPDGRLTLHGRVFTADGSRMVQAQLTTGPTDDPAVLGDRVGAELRRQGASGLIAETGG